MDNMQPPTILALLGIEQRLSHPEDILARWKKISYIISIVPLLWGLYLGGVLLGLLDKYQIVQAALYITSNSIFEYILLPTINILNAVVLNAISALQFCTFAEILGMSIKLAIVMGLLAIHGAIAITIFSAIVLPTLWLPPLILVSISLLPWYVASCYPSVLAHVYSTYHAIFKCPTTVTRGEYRELVYNITIFYGTHDNIVNDNIIPFLDTPKRYRSIQALVKLGANIQDFPQYAQYAQYAALKRSFYTLQHLEHIATKISVNDNYDDSTAAFDLFTDRPELFLPENFEQTYGQDPKKVLARSFELFRKMPFKEKVDPEMKILPDIQSNNVLLSQPPTL